MDVCVDGLIEMEVQLGVYGGGTTEIQRCEIGQTRRMLMDDDALQQYSRDRGGGRKGEASLQPSQRDPAEAVS